MLCVPTFQINVLSGPQVAMKGARCNQHSDKCVIANSSSVPVLYGKLENGLYRLECQLPQVGRVSATAGVDVWHKRLGHISYDTVISLAKGEAVQSMGKITGAVPDKSCSVCDKAKQTRNPFPPSHSHATAPLELIHCDVMKLPCHSLDGDEYVVTLLDDYSRYSEVVCLSGKNEAAQAVINVIVEWQRQAMAKVKKIRTDRGTEFLGDLKEYMRNKGIIHQTSVAYNPEQNGRAERLNRTLLERSRALLMEHGLPKNIWNEAIRTANYLRNLVPTTKQVLTPTELLFKRKPLTYPWSTATNLTLSLTSVLWLDILRHPKRTDCLHQVETASSPCSMLSMSRFVNLRPPHFCPPTPTLSMTQLRISMFLAFDRTIQNGGVHPTRSQGVREKTLVKKPVPRAITRMKLMKIPMMTTLHLSRGVLTSQTRMSLKTCHIDTQSAIGTHHQNGGGPSMPASM